MACIKEIKEIKEIKDVPLTQRVCKHCGELKLIDNFYKTSIGGYRHRCKKCETIRRATYFKDYHKKTHKPSTIPRGRPKKQIQSLII